jgi:hypothetical protein
MQVDALKKFEAGIISERVYQLQVKSSRYADRDAGLGLSSPD